MNKPAYTATPTPDRIMCALGYTDHATDDTGQVALPRADTGLLCGRHRRDLDRWAEEIADGWFTLAMMVEPGRAGRSGGGSLKRVDAPVPIDLVVAALRDHRNSTARLTRDTGDIPSVPGVVASWLLLVDAQMPLRHVGWVFHPDPAIPPSPRVVRPLGPRLPSSMLAQLKLLVRSHDWMAGQEWVVQYWHQLRQVHDAIMAKTEARTFAGTRGSRAIAEEIARAVAAR